MAALRNKKYGQILNKNTSPYLHGASLAIWPLTMLKRTHFGEVYYVHKKSPVRSKPREGTGDG